MKRILHALTLGTGGTVAFILVGVLVLRVIPAGLAALSRWIDSLSDVAENWLVFGTFSVVLSVFAYVWLLAREEQKRGHEAGEEAGETLGASAPQDGGAGREEEA